MSIPTELAIQLIFNAASPMRRQFSDKV